MKSINLLLTFLIASFLFPFYIHAADPAFDATLHLTYDISESGTSQVTAKVDITNKTSDQYVTNFELQIKGPPPLSATAADSQGSLPIDIIPRESSTGLKMTFLHPVGGKGRNQSAQMTYPGPSAQLKDTIWELRLPAISPPDFLDDIEVTAITPADFGIPVQVNPLPDQASTLSDGRHKITFKKTDGGLEPITIRYGNFSTYAFTLTYKLDNPSSKSVVKTINIPSDSYEHQIKYDKIDPLPLNVQPEADNSWSALYELPPRTSTTVTVMGNSASRENPQQFFKSFAQGVALTNAVYEYSHPQPPEISWSLPWQYLPFVSNPVNLIVKNPNGSALYNLPVVVGSQGFKLESSEDRLIKVLPPFGHTSLPLHLAARFLPPEGEKTVFAGIGSLSVTFPISDSYVIVWYSLYVIIITLTIIALGFVAAKAGHIHLQKRRR